MRATILASYVNAVMVARYIEPPVVTGREAEDARLLRLFLNRVEESALHLLDEHGGEAIGFVLCTREHYDELNARKPAKRARAKKSRRGATSQQEGDRG